MKILVSSKSFAEFLKGIDLECVYDVHVFDGEVSIVTSTNTHTRSVENQGEGIAVQHNIRYDWLHHDLSSIQDQPVVIEFLDNVARFALSY